LLGFHSQALSFKGNSNLTRALKLLGVVKVVLTKVAFAKKIVPRLNKYDDVIE